ncbi:MAG: hypothetical protein AAB449_03275 [Patescibacteria group bacterium]
MKRYIEHMHTKEPHERRAHAMRVALLATAALFFVWMTTLGVRLASQNPAQTADGASSAELANVLSGAYAPNTLEVVQPEQ